MPRTDRRTKAPSVFGKPDVSYPYDDLAYPRVVEVYTVSQLRDKKAYLSPHPNTELYPDLVLTEQDSEPGDNTDTTITEVYEKLPGPWMPFTRYDENLGPIQGRRRTVANSGQTATLTATGKTTYEARETSDIVSWEIEEMWSDGSGTEGNPAFPIIVKDFFDEKKGAVHEVVQLTTDLSSAGEESQTGDVITEISYDPFNQFLRRKTVTTYGPTFPVVVADRYEEPRGAIHEVIQLTTDVSSNGSESLDTGVVSEIRFEPVNKVVREKIISTYGPDFPIVVASKYDEERGDVEETTQLVVATGTEAGTEEFTGTGGVGTCTKTEYTPFNKFLLRRTIKTFSLPGPLREGSAMVSHKQTAAVTKQLILAGSETADAGATIESSTISSISALLAEKSVADVGSVAPLSELAWRQEPVIPREFQTITSVTVEETSAVGTQSRDTLGTDGLGVLNSTVRAEDIYQSRKTTTTVNGTNTDTLTLYTKNEADQLITVVETFGDPSTPSITATTEFVQQTAVGNGKVRMRIGTAPSLFDRASQRNATEVNYPDQFLGDAKTVTESSVSAGTSTTPDTVQLDGLGIIAAEARRVSALAIQKSKTTKSGTPAPIYGFELDEYTGSIFQTTSTAEENGTAGADVGISGTFTEVRPFNTAWAIKTIRKSTTLTSRTYTTSRHVNLPPVLTVFTPIVFTNSEGQVRHASYYSQFKDFSGPFLVSVEESWSRTAVSIDGPTQLFAQGFSWVIPYSSGSVERCFHEAINIAGTTGTTDPEFGYITWDYTIAATSPTTLSGDIVLADEQIPWRGGFKRTKETITIA